MDILQLFQLKQLIVDPTHIIMHRDIAGHCCNKSSEKGNWQWFNPLGY